MLLRPFETGTLPITFVDRLTGPNSAGQYTWDISITSRDLFPALSGRLLKFGFDETGTSRLVITGYTDDAVIPLTADASGFYQEGPGPSSPSFPERTPTPLRIAMASSRSRSTSLEPDQCPLHLRQTARTCSSLEK